MLFYEKENVFMYLVAFQNIFRKIFYGVWKRSWKRRRKRQNPEKPGQTQRNTARSRDRRCDLRSQSTTQSRKASIAIGVNGASCEIAPRDLVFFLSLSFSLCASSLCASLIPKIIWSENRNGNEFLWSTLLFYGQLKMISGKFNFPNQPNSLFYGQWFPETIFTQNKHSLT